MPRAGDVEVDEVSARVAVGLRDGPAQAADAAVQRVHDGEGGGPGGSDEGRQDHPQADQDGPGYERVLHFEPLGWLGSEGARLRAGAAHPDWTHGPVALP